MNMQIRGVRAKGISTGLNFSGRGVGEHRRERWKRRRKRG